MCRGGGGGEGGAWPPFEPMFNPLLPMDPKGVLQVSVCAIPLQSPVDPDRYCFANLTAGGSSKD